jgi:hypothetical protein
MRKWLPYLPLLAIFVVVWAAFAGFGRLTQSIFGAQMNVSTSMDAYEIALRTAFWPAALQPEDPYQ